MRLIDADTLSAKYKIEYDHADAMGNAHRKKGWQGALQLLYDAPTIEAEPMKHGRWVRYYDGKYIMCSSCEESFWSEYGGVTTYCPNCGAKMEEEEGT